LLLAQAALVVRYTHVVLIIRAATAILSVLLWLKVVGADPLAPLEPTLATVAGTGALDSKALVGLADTLATAATGPTLVIAEVMVLAEAAEAAQGVELFMVAPLSATQTLALAEVLAFWAKDQVALAVYIPVHTVVETIRVPVGRAERHL
jgi:hypothetical protein